MRFKIYQHLKMTKNKQMSLDEIIMKNNPDYDFYVSHTFSHWIRDLEEFGNKSK